MHREHSYLRTDESRKKAEPGHRGLECCDESLDFIYSGKWVSTKGVLVHYRSQGLNAQVQVPALPLMWPRERCSTSVHLSFLIC